MKHTTFEIVRAQAQDAAALLEYLKIVGGETDNLSFGAEGCRSALKQSKTICMCSVDRVTMFSILPRWGMKS